MDPLTDSHEEVYTESQIPCFAPLTFFLPLFWKYSVRITKAELSFGYLTSCCRKTLPLSDIDRGSVSTGSSTCMENLSNYGGWGIRLAGGGVVYNPNNGPWVSFATKSDGRYHFSTNNPEKVASLLRGGGI